ncbi:MAG: hypothetical protein ISS82_06290 [Nanoarchaeota archaeon]|nr:hypothetical protein [Nanoarchaeota archaeon]
MKFDIEKKKRPYEINITDEAFRLARIFAKKIYDELGKFIYSAVLFGSTTTEAEHKYDVDILIIIDDVHIQLTPEFLESYKIIVEKIIASIDIRIHIQTMKLGSFWEFIRAGDPVAINILRSGIALIDYGFFEPLQHLLRQGRIRPSLESIYNYYTMAPKSLENSKRHILAAFIDLYWAVIDASHAALMCLNITPPSPDHVGDMLRDHMVKKRLLKAKYVKYVNEFYYISKKISHREIAYISGKDYDEYLKKATELVNVLKKFIEKKENMV